MAMRFIACPGQGSQTVGFLTPWIQDVPGFKAKLETLSQVCEKDLIWLGTEADEDTIKDTSNSQPLIVAAGIAAFRTALADLKFDGVVGHSVGEFTAAAIAGVLSDKDAMKLVSLRASAMAEASEMQKTSMAAVLGGEEDAVLSHLEDLGLFAANFNGSGQIVAAGAKDRILSLVANPPEKSRVIELKVAGAFHTSFMKSAEDALASRMSEFEVADPTTTLLSNQAGQIVESGSEFLSLMLKQVSRPVRWDKCMKTLNDFGGELIELPPAGALSGLAKRGMDAMAALAIKAPADLEKIGV
jgi:[acyl-carrier-protein] S-malonyltransferase